MKRNDLLNSVFQELQHKTARSAMAIIAVALFMGCMLVMMAFGLGGKSQFLSSISGNDAIEIVVTRAAGASTPKLDDTAIASFRGIEGVEAATGVITLPMQVKIGGYAAQNVFVTAVDPSVFQGRLAFEKGGLFGSQTGSPQIVLGYGALLNFKNSSAQQQPQSFDAEASQSAAPTPPPVDWLSQNAQLSFGKADSSDGESGSAPPSDDQTRTYSGSISGILKEDKSDLDGQALMNLSLVKKILRENYSLASSLNLNANSYAQAFVFVKDLGSTQDVTDKINAKGFTAASAVADLKSLQEEMALQQTLLILFEIFAALASGLILAVILLRGMVGRGNKIDQIGVSHSNNRLILTQASLLAFFGGVGGVLLGYFFALITNTSSTETVVFGMHFGQVTNLVIPFWLALVTIVISAATGLVAGWLCTFRQES